jgi:hypothetical protein
MQKKAVFAEHLPLRETELLYELPVVVVGHIFFLGSDPTEELGRHYEDKGPKFKQSLSGK